LKKENAFEEVEKARELLSSEGNFVNQMQIPDQTNTKISLDEQECQRYMIEKGTPSKEDLIVDLKNFFEGPINMDLMLLGGVKQLGLHQGNIPSKEQASSVAQSLGVSMVLSQ
jgi:hypothetical protein